MARPTHNTYIGIPPPPLPEFYMKTTAVDAASASSGTEEVETVSSLKAPKAVFEKINERRRHPAAPGDGTDERYEYVNKRSGSDITSSLAVYHVCRLCLRPRSARYHREHPIPVDGVPPPPGICRRCRVTSASDTTSLAEVLEHHESYGPKIGVKCLVTDQDYLSASQARSSRVDYNADEFEWREMEPPPTKRSAPANQSPPKQTEYIYRHVHVAMPPPPIHPPPPRPPQNLPPPTVPGSEPMYTYVPKPTVKSTAQDAIDSMSAKSSHSAKGTQYEIRPVEEHPPAEPATTDIWRVKSREESLLSKLNAEPEIQSHAGRSDGSKLEWIESRIRSLARDEVERYRQAERKMEAHGDAYAHGRMVPVERVPVIPVERRIEAQHDVVDEMPWKTKSKEKKKETAYGTKKSEYMIRSESQAGREEILVVRRSGREPYEKHWLSRAEPSTASEASSDKTRWPSKPEQNRKTSAPFLPSQKERGDAKQADASNGRAERRVGHWVDYYGRRNDHSEVHGRNDQVSELRNDYARSLGRPQPFHYQEVRIPSDCRDRGIAASAREGSKQKIRHHTQGLELPYPRDDVVAPVPMPSPSSHASRPVKKASSRKDDGEYYYKLRTVQPVDESGYVRGEDLETYYKETSESLHRRKGAPSSAKPDQEPQSVLSRRETRDRRPSDVSSRVRFANKVAISPTPPGSDASSAQFHKRQQRGPEEGPDMVRDFEYERRGRSPSRVGRHESAYGPEAYYARPSLRGRRPSGETETATAPSTIPIDVRQLARAQSESPSREKLFAEAKYRRQDAFGPYTAEHQRSTSVEAYDGSSVGEGSDSDRAIRKQRQERQERREYSGRQGRH